MPSERFWGAAAALFLSGSLSLPATLTEDFQSHPAARGWQTFGQSELFAWDPAGRLQVRWDSAQGNSYYYKPLGTVLGKTDDFSVQFDLLIDEITVGVNSGKAFTFQLALGFLRLRQAFAPGFLRGTGSASPNLVEFDYFPDSGFGATVSPVIVSSNNQFRPSFTFPFELTVGEWFQVEMRYTGREQRLSTSVQRNGEGPVAVKDVELGSDFTDFRVDTLAICSYSDEGAGGSLFARGWVDNITVVVPDPPHLEIAGRFHEGRWQGTVISPKTWLLTLERTEDWRIWHPVSESVPGTGEGLVLREESPSSSHHAFYRVRVERP